MITEATTMDIANRYKEMEMERRRIADEAHDMLMLSLRETRSWLGIDEIAHRQELLLEKHFSAHVRGTGSWLLHERAVIEMIQEGKNQNPYVGQIL